MSTPEKSSEHRPLAADEESAAASDRWLRYNVSAASRSRAILIGISTVAVIACVLAIRDHHRVLTSHAGWLGVVAIVVAPTLAWLAHLHGGAERVARERQWVSAIPFALPGYFEALRRAPPADPERAMASITLHFVRLERTPGTTLVGGLLLAMGDDSGAWLSATPAGPGCVDVTVRPLVELHDWFHLLAERVLLPLHAHFPLAAATVRIAPTPHE